MTPAGATLVAVRIKTVVLTNGGKLGVHNTARIDAGVHQRLANGGRKIEHTGSGSIDARELGGKAVHKFLRHLVLVTQNMGANIGRDIIRLAASCLAECLAGLGGNARNRALPARVHHGKAAGSHQHHGNAIGKAEHHGYLTGRADDGITTLGNLLANVHEIIGTIRGHRHDMVTVYLIGNKQVVLALGGTQGLEYAATIFLNGKGVIANMRAQIK